MTTLNKAGMDLLHQRDPLSRWLPIIGCLVVLAGSVLLLKGSLVPGTIPVLVGCALMLLGAERGRRRARQMLKDPTWCRVCGYEVGDSDTCSECGAIRLTPTLRWEARAGPCNPMQEDAQASGAQAWGS